MSYCLEGVLVDVLHSVVYGVPRRSEGASLAVGVVGDDVNGGDVEEVVDGDVVVGDISALAVNEDAAVAYALGGVPYLIDNL